MNQYADNEAHQQQIKADLDRLQAVYERNQELTADRVKFVRYLQHQSGENIYAEQYRGVQKCGLDGDVTGLGFYLDRRATDPNLKDDQGNTCVHKAAEGGHVEAMKFLLNWEERDEDRKKRDERRDRRALQDARLAGGNAVAIALENAGETPQRTADIHVRNNKGWTPLMSAAAHGQGEVIYVLYQKGSDIMAQDHQGFTAAHWAALGNHTEALKVIYQCQDLPLTPDVVSKPSNNGTTPAHTAAQHDCSEALLFLAKTAKVDLNAQDDSLDTPGHRAARNNFIELLDVLRQNEADFTIENIDDDTVEDIIQDKSAHY